MAELHVFEFNQCEWVIAASREDAVKVWAEFTGVDEEIADDEEDDWVELPDDKMLGFFVDKDGEMCEIGTGDLIERPASYWIQKMGRRYLATTET